MAVATKTDEEKLSLGIEKDTYKIRKIGGGVSVSIPKKLIKEKAKEHRISVEEFLERFRVRALFDDFEGFDIAYEFVEEKPD